VDELAASYGVAMLHFSELQPFPGTGKFDYLAFLERAKLTVCVEQNATGQFARLMKSETGYEFTEQVLRFDGRPFTIEGLVKELKAKISRL
jgi:2-oxoglutarate ferredoxin oxidoreductase subunit alpha